MIDRSITVAQLGRDYMGGKSAKTAKRRVIQDGIPYHLDRGCMLIKQSDAEAWRDARRVHQNESVTDSLKGIMQRAVQRARERRAS